MENEDFDSLVSGFGVWVLAKPKVAVVSEGYIRMEGTRMIVTPISTASVTLISAPLNLSTTLL